jgi:exodeoxyribonuclease VII large subunit
MYFTLKDEAAEIEAVMFSDYNALLQFAPADGQKVIVFGKITLYERRGRLSDYRAGDATRRRWETPA